MSSMARLEQVLKGIKSLQARTRGRSLPRSAAQNERGVAEEVPPGTTRCYGQR